MFTTSAVLALATVNGASTVASAKTADKIKPPRSKPESSTHSKEQILSVSVEPGSSADIQHEVVRYVVIQANIEKDRPLFIVLKAVCKQAEELSVGSDSLG